MRQRVVPFFDVQPSHASLPNRSHELEGGHTRHIVRQGIDQQVNLHPTDLRGVVVDQFNIRIQLGLGMLKLGIALC